MFTVGDVVHMGSKGDHAEELDACILGNANIAKQAFIAS